jgi:hypothetical protein
MKRPSPPPTKRDKIAQRFVPFKAGQSTRLKRVKQERIIAAMHRGRRQTPASKAILNFYNVRYHRCAIRPTASGRWPSRPYKIQWNQ